MSRFPTLPGLPRIAIRTRFVLALILCVLIAFGVAIGMAVLLPPGAARPIRIDAVAVALRGPGDTILIRDVVAAPPAAGDRWLEAPGARRQLAAILRLPVADVRMLVAAPVQVRPTDARIALAERAPIRAGFLPFAQVENGASPAPAPAPSPVVVAPPNPRPAPAAAVRATPAPAATVRRPDTERSRVREERPRAPVRDAPVRVAPARLPAPAPAPDAAPAPVVAPVTVPIRPAIVPVPVPQVATIAPGAIQEVLGEFRAALRLPDGRWAVVRPRPEPFPTTAQQRMILWLLVALAVSVPLAWLLAVVLVRPLRRFADAADQGGRDPSQAAVAAATPIELAPAAAALLRLQGRVQSLSGDRSAFAGMLRSEVRAPLERLRSGLDDAPRQIREAFYDDVSDIEEAVAGLQLFLTDAAAPAAMARHDLGALVRSVAAAANERGEPVMAEAMAVAWVDVDPAAIGRALDQMIANSRRQGGDIVMLLAIEPDSATVSVMEMQPPEPVAADPAVPAGFAPGLRGKAERSGGTRPSGPGLAVARSIARAHGGEVLLVRSDHGMTLMLRLPIAGRTG